MMMMMTMMILIQMKKSIHIYITTDFNTKIQRNRKVNKFDIYIHVHDIKFRIMTM